MFSHFTANSRSHTAICSAVAFWILFAASRPCAGQNLAGQQSAADAIRKLGGQVEVDRESLGHPVVTVRLAETAVTDEVLGLLSHLPDLERLDLRATRITDAGLAHLKVCPRLRSLNLISAGRVTDAGLAHLKGLSQLEHLDLQGTGVTGTGFAHLSGLKRLRAIRLSGDRITDETIKQLASLAGLEELLLAYTRVTDEGMAHLAAIPGVRRLHLRSGRISDPGLTHLKGAANLELLEIASTPRVTDAARADLRRTRPKLQVRSNGSDLPNDAEL